MTNIEFYIDPWPDKLRTMDTFSEEEIRKLRPIAETLAMMDGNAFFSMDEGEWYRHYIPEAALIYAANGGDEGWAGLASFAKPFAEGDQ